MLFRFTVLALGGSGGGIGMLTGGYGKIIFFRNKLTSLTS